MKRLQPDCNFLIHGRLEMKLDDYLLGMFGKFRLFVRTASFNRLAVNFLITGYLEPKVDD